MLRCLEEPQKDKELHVRLYSVSNILLDVRACDSTGRRTSPFRGSSRQRLEAGENVTSNTKTIKL